MNYCPHLEAPERGALKNGRNLPDPFLAGIFALVGLSLGHFYNGRTIRGLIWGVLGVVVFLYIRGNAPAAPAGFLFLAACAIDSSATAEEINRGLVPHAGISPFFWLEIILAVSAGMALAISVTASLLPVLVTNV